MSEHAAVRFANEAFYIAFAGRDMEAMEALWARRAAVSCIHPGWGPLAGREAVLESWRAILSQSQSPRVQCRNQEAHVLGDVAYVVCHEALTQDFLVATNIFVREDGAWKMVHHQAGPAPPPPEDEPEDPETVQ